MICVRQFVCFSTLVHSLFRKIILGSSRTQSRCFDRRKVIEFSKSIYSTVKVMKTLFSVSSLFQRMANGMYSSGSSAMICIIAAVQTESVGCLFANYPYELRGNLDRDFS